jgi:hypothetical protein
VLVVRKAEADDGAEAEPPPRKRDLEFTEGLVKMRKRARRWMRSTGRKILYPVRSRTVFE